MREPAVSVIVCTRDRPQQLLECVAAVAVAARQWPALETEIIVLENLSKPHLALDANEVLRTAEGHGVFIKLTVGGLSNARNAGMDAARGRLLVFTDDDCIMDPGYIRDLAQHVADRPGHVFIGGRVKLANPRDLPFTIKDSPDPETYGVSSHPGGFVPGCNFVISRMTADRIGHFDTRFGAGAPFKAGEDTDYIIRAHQAGVPIHYVPDMCVLHNHGRQHLHEVEQLSYCYSFANGALYGKYMRDAWLLKHLYWGLRSAVREKFGGPAFNPELGLSWGAVLRANLAGLRAYMTAPRPTHHTSLGPGLHAPPASTGARQLND